LTKEKTTADYTQKIPISEPVKCRCGHDEFLRNSVISNRVTRRRVSEDGLVDYDGSPLAPEPLITVYECAKCGVAYDAGMNDVSKSLGLDRKPEKKQIPNYVA
jgi:hypothetical protein